MGKRYLNPGSLAPEPVSLTLRLRCFPAGVVTETSHDLMWGCRLSCWSVWHCQCIPFMQCIFTQKKKPKKSRQSNFNSCNNKLKKKLQHLPRQWCSTDKVSRHGWEMVDTYLLKICSGRRLRRGSLPEESWRRSPWDWQSRTSSLTETSHLRQSSVSLTVLEGVRLLFSSRTR